MKADSVRLQRQPLIAPSDVRSDGIGGREAKVGTPFGARLRALMHRVFSRSRASEDAKPLAARGAQVATPLTSRKTRAAAQKDTTAKVGDLLTTLKATSESTVVSDSIAMRDVLNDMPRTMKPLVTAERSADLVFREAVRDQLSSVTKEEAQSMYEKLVNGEKSGTGVLDSTDLHFRALQLELLAKFDAKGVEWIEKTGSPKPAPHQVLPDPAFRALLLDHLKEELSTENLVAYSVVENLLDPTQPALTKDIVSRFFGDYIKAGSIYQVNISADDVAGLKTAIDKGTHEEMAKALGVIRGALAQIMIRDSIPRFLVKLQPSDVMP